MKKKQYRYRLNNKAETATNLSTRLRIQNVNNLKCNDIKTLISNTSTIFISEKDMTLHNKNIIKNINSLRETLGNI